jgi:hypothetical protein
MNGRIMFKTAQTFAQSFAYLQDGKGRHSDRILKKDDTMGTSTAFCACTTPSTLIGEEMQDQAKLFTDLFQEPDSPAGCGRLDYSVASLEVVECLLDDFHRSGTALDEMLHFLISAYVFECARKEFGGRYFRSDHDNPLVLVVGGQYGDVVFCAMEAVRRNASLGPQAGLQAAFRKLQAAIVTQTPDCTAPALAGPH